MGQCLSLVQQCLVPAIKRNDIVVTDNPPVHKVAGVQQAIETADARLLYLLPYSNSIEPAFSKFRAHLRKATEHTIPGLLRRIVFFVKARSPPRMYEFLAPRRLCSNMTGIWSRVAQTGSR